MSLSVKYPTGAVNRNAKQFNKMAVQQEPTVSFQGEPGKLYTLIMSDPQANPQAKNNTKPLQEGFASYLHWLVVNIPSPFLLQEGTVKKSYSPPTPPPKNKRPNLQELHYYYFQVYEQPYQLMEEYAADFEKPGSPFFKVQQFVQKNNLILKGQVRIAVHA